MPAKMLKSDEQIPFEEIIADLNSYILKADPTKRGYWHRSEATRDRIKMRFRERLEANCGDVQRTVQDFFIVHRVKADEWLGTDMAKYYRPETLYRPCHFESYLNQMEAPPPLTDDQKRTIAALKQIEKMQRENPKLPPPEQKVLGAGI